MAYSADPGSIMNLKRLGSASARVDNHHASSGSEPHFLSSGCAGQGDAAVLAMQKAALGRTRSSNILTPVPLAKHVAGE